MSYDKHWIKRVRWLTQALIISGTINIGLISTFIYFVLKEKQQPLATQENPVSKIASKKNSQNLTLQQVIAGYSRLSYHELLLRLENKDFVEEGYSKRDLALACLVAFRHFNLERALGGLNIQKRRIGFLTEEGKERFEVTIFPGLADYQYEAIIQYAKTEKWPLTPHGLFIQIQSLTGSKDPSLLDAFYLTPEFHYLYALFIRSGSSIKKEMLVQILSEGSWELLENFAQELRKTSDFSAERRRAFLMQHIQQKSASAAQVILQCDYEFALKKLDDAQVLLLLDILSLKTPEVFVKELSASPRSDAVLNKARVILNLMKGEPAETFASAEPKPVALVPKEAVEPAIQFTKPIEKQKKNHLIYTIQPGDNLWKLARKYKVPIEVIMKLNKLESDRLKPGKQIEIPLQ